MNGDKCGHPDGGSDVISFYEAAMFVPLRRPCSGQI